MKNFKKRDLPKKCIIDPDCVECESIEQCRNQCHDEDCRHEHECLSDPGNSVLISALPSHHKCSHDSIIAKGRGRITDKETDPNIDLEFKFIITDNHGCINGDVAIADYKKNILLSSDNLHSYTQCTPCSFCAVFCDFNHTQTRYIILCGLRQICGNPAELFIFSPPFCGVEEVSTGGEVNDGYIKIADSEGCC